MERPAASRTCSTRESVRCPADGDARQAPAAADRDDRGRQLDARPQEVLELVATNVASALEADACFVYLYDERADELVLRATHGTRVEEMTRGPRMRPGEGITGSAAAERAPVMLESQAHLDPRFKHFPNLPEDQYESILAVPILTRDERARGSAQRPDARAARLRRGRGRAAARDRRPGRAVDRAREALRRGAAARARARGARPHLGGRLELALPRGVARGDRQDDDGRALGDGRRARARRRPDRVARRHAPARTRSASRCAGGAGRSASWSPTARRRSPQPTSELLASIATHAAVALEHGRAVMRGVLAQEIHHRVKNNLQTVASLLRLQARVADAIDPREALEHSVNRILAIAAVHEVLTERRDEDVDLADLIDRLRAMLVQGVGGGKEVSATLQPVSLAGSRATALALVFSELLQNALEHGGRRVRVELSRRGRRRGARDRRRRRGHRRRAEAGTGLSIVRALVRDELRGTLELRSDGGTRAEVVFPV